MPATFSSPKSFFIPSSRAVVVLVLFKFLAIKTTAFFFALSSSESFSILAKCNSMISLKNENLKVLIFFAWSGDGVFIHANSALSFFWTLVTSNSYPHLKPFFTISSCNWNNFLFLSVGLEILTESKLATAIESNDLNTFPLQ